MERQEDGGQGGEPRGGDIRERKGSTTLRSFPQRRSSSMISEEDVPAPVPPCSELAPGRNVKPMRDEPGSDSDADESEEWEDDDKAYSEEEESDEEERVSNAGPAKGMPGQKRIKGMPGQKRIKGMPQCLGKNGQRNARAKADPQGTTQLKRKMPGQKRTRKGLVRCSSKAK